jgi:hypothetical protein
MAREKTPPCAAMNGERLPHAEFVAAFREGRIAVRVDPERAPRFVSARLLLPLVLLPVLGLAVALALVGFVIIGLALGVAAVLVRYLVRRSSAGFVLARSMQRERFYRDALDAAVLRVEPKP